MTWQNVPPTADAGADQTVDEGDTVTLDGSNSTDPDDGIASYQWSQTTAGQSVTLSDTTAVMPTFTAPDVGASGEALTFQLTVTDHGGLASADTCVVNVTDTTATTVRLDMDNLPENEGWQVFMGSPAGTSWVSNGILTIDSPSYLEYTAPDDWINSVSNQNGWIIETKMRLDPTTVDDTSGSILIWIHDNTYLTQIGFHKDKVFIDYPDYSEHPMNTTSTFHVYRIEGKGQSFKLFVDGKLAIDYKRTVAGGGSQVLFFGDGVWANYSKSYWDYFFYIIF